MSPTQSIGDTSRGCLALHVARRTGTRSFAYRGRQDRSSDAPPVCPSRFTRTRYHPKPVCPQSNRGGLRFGTRRGSQDSRQRIAVRGDPLRDGVTVSPRSLSTISTTKRASVESLLGSFIKATDPSLQAHRPKFVKAALGKVTEPRSLTPLRSARHAYRIRHRRLCSLRPLELVVGQFG